MKVFVAGAGGAIGRPLVRQLLAVGHEVTGMTRRPERAEEIRAAGAAAALCDVYDKAALEAAVAAAEPQAVMHVLTDLPDRIVPRRDYLASTNRIRSEGTGNLLAAAKAAGVERVIAEGVGFLYEPGGDGPNVEADPISSQARGIFAAAVAALVALEAQVLDHGGTVLRFGWLYGPGTHLAADGTQAEEVRRRRFPIVGDGGGVFSFVQVEDAAAAYVAALGAAADGVFNIVDDEPAPQRVWLPVYAEELGAPPPRRVPAWLARLVAGGPAIESLEGMSGASAAKAKSELGWQPRYPSWREGFREALG